LHFSRLLQLAFSAAVGERSLALRAGGTAVGWGFQLQSPLVIAALALIILGAALNLLGHGWS
jgi:thiol:disulfide interchange protein